MLFSVIIPTYNRAGFISETVRSVLKQSYQDFEVLIVDDGSTDETEKIIRENFSLPKIFYLKTENRERGAARNFGAKKAKGDYVVFLDSDDLLLENHLEEANKFITQNKSPKVFHLNYQYQTGPNTVSHRLIKDKTVNQMLISGNVLSCDGVFIEKNVALQNPFNENRLLSGMEDWELWLRLAVQYPIFHINTCTSILIHHDERSVLHTDITKLTNKVNYFMDCVLNNKAVTEHFKKDLNSFKASCFAYLSLHIALLKKHKPEALKFLFKSLTLKPTVVFERRFLGTIKNLILR